MRNLEKGQHIFIAFQGGKAVLDSQLRPRMYTSLENADRWTPTVNKGKIEYVEYAPTLIAPNEPLTLEQLREMDAPVYCACKPIEGGDGYWCLCRHGHIITPGGTFFEVGEISHWVFYRRPPEGET